VLFRSWIAYLQWHFRTQGSGRPPEPVLKDFHNIAYTDAVLSYERVEFATDEAGRPPMRRDGLTFKPHPVTGEDVPDETDQVAVERYLNPRPGQTLTSWSATRKPSCDACGPEHRTRGVRNPRPGALAAAGIPGPVGNPSPFQPPP
jgi:hypothetical protein